MQGRELKKMKNLEVQFKSQKEKVKNPMAE
jgi:hypothetical protein